jgi:hypothetical protein
LSASCTAASRPAPATTRPPRGATGKTSTNLKQPLDVQTPGMSWLTIMDLAPSSDSSRRQAARRRARFSLGHARISR